MPDQIQPLKEDYFSSTLPPKPLETAGNPISGPIPETSKKHSPLSLIPKINSKILKTISLAIGGILTLVVIFFLVKFAIGKFSKSSTATIIYWGLFEPQSVMQQVISDYEKQHPGIKIKYSQQTMTQYRERLQQRLSSNSQQDKTSASTETPDIFRIHQSWIPMFTGLLSTVPVSIYDNTTFEKTFYPSAKESLSVQGKYVGIPLMSDGLSLFCNQDLFRAKGIEFPKDWKELKVAAQQLKATDEQGRITTAGVALGTTGNIDHWSDILGLMLLQSGVDLSNPGKCTAGDNGDVCPGADALKFFTNFVSEDRVWDSTLPTSTFAFAKGNLAMYFGPSWRVFEIEEMKGKLKSNFQYKIIPVPQLPMEGEGKVAWSTYWVEAVSKKSKYQTEAWEFLKYLSSKEVLQKLYQTESVVRPFGEPYSRIEMAESLKNSPFVGAFLEQAPYAKNWYLSSSTNDNGINDKIIKYYEDAVNSVNKGDDPISALQTVAKGVAQVFNQYGISK